MSTPQGDVTELRFQAGTSNKFYRIYKVNNGGHYVVLNWGRWGATGQFKVEQFASEGAATTFALNKRDEKANKGYELLRQSQLPVVPADILDLIEQKTGQKLAPAPQPAQAATPVTGVSLFDQFAAETDRLIRLVTSAPDLTPEAVVLRSTLSEQLDDLRARLQQSEGQLELVNDVIAMKIGA